MERNHYQIVGLEPTASREAIATALQRLSDQAAVLVYTSPQRSNELWERIRQIREDLLLDPEQRAAYDRSLLAARAAVPAGAEMLTAPPPPATMERRRAPRRGAFIWRTLGSVAVLALAAALFVVVGHRSRANRPPGPLALALSSTGLQHRYQYVSGQMVHLRWSRVPHALVYRVQIATGSQSAKDLGVFRHPMLTRLTLGTAYSVKVLGPQVYYWRVQAYIRDAWSPYTRAQHFVVAGPNVMAPVPQAPPIRIARAPKKMPSHRVVAAVVRRSRVRAASRSGGRILPTPQSHQAAQTVRQVAALVRSPARVPAPATPAVARMSSGRPVSPLPTRSTPPAPATLPSPRLPVATPRPTPAPAPKSPTHPPAPPAVPRPPVSPPAGTVAPRPPASVSPTPLPAPPAPPAGSVKYPVAAAPVTAAPSRSPLSPVAPAAPPAGTVGRGTATSSRRSVSVSVTRPTAQPVPAYSPHPKHRVVSVPHGSGAPATSTDASSDD